MSGFNQNPGMGGKNPPWARPANNVTANVINSAALSLYQQIAQASLQLQAGFQSTPFRFPQFPGQNQTSQDATNSSTNVSTFNPLNPVRYPTQVTTAYPSSGSQVSNMANTPSQSSQGNPSSTSATPTQKTRVFTGKITRKQENFGFIDDNVFFRSTAVQGREPSVGDSVLVEATFNDAMPFKWNATRVQAVNSSRNSNSSRYSDGAFYNSTTSVAASNVSQFESRSRDPRPRDRHSPDRSVSERRNEDRRSERDRHSREKDADHKMRDSRRLRHSPERESKTNRDRERDRDRSRSSPSHVRSRSPARRHVKNPPRYMVQVPRITLDLPEVDVLELRRRYPNLYIPSDFFLGEIRWVDQFPPLSPFVLDHPCNFHIMKKDTDPVYKNDTVLDPPDVDYLYSAKVMLMSMPSLEDIHRKCIALAQDTDKDDYHDVVHPSRLLNFLVGVKGKNEAMAIGGPWSPSLDGQNPDKDPSVLIRTAIRTCKGLTGIDLSNCTQWYRFVEIHYQRSDILHKGKHIPARVETVVLFLPDVWSCIPTQLEWEKIKSDHKKFVENSLDPDKSADADSKCELESGVKSSLSTPITPDDDKEADQNTESDSCTPAEKGEPSHYSQLDPKNMKVQHLKDELEARNLSSKGLKYQLTARLTKALKLEEEAKKKEDEEKMAESIKEEEEKKKEAESWTVVDSWSSVDDKSTSQMEKNEDKKEKEKLKASLDKKYTLPDSPHVIVYPSRTAKSGKFECSLMSLSLLLDYRPNDNKEHLFEIYLFAEFFNEMLMRDFGFSIYRALHKAPEKSKEDDNKEDEKRKTDEKKSGVEEADKKEKRLDKVKHYTENKKLLLAFSYFDTTRVGYILDKDLENLLFSLGLHLSRAQVKKLLAKVIKRDSLTYRKLTDKPLEEQTEQPTASNAEDSCIDEGISSQLSAGKKRKTSTSSSPCRKIPKTEACEGDGDNSKSDFIHYKGSLINIENITSQLKRRENARLETESALIKLKADYCNVEKSLADSNDKIKSLLDESKQINDQLATVNAKCLSLNSQNEKLTAAIHQVNKVIKPFVLPQEDKFLNPNELDKINVTKIKVEKNVDDAVTT